MPRVCTHSGKEMSSSSVLLGVHMLVLWSTQEGEPRRKKGIPCTSTCPTAHLAKDPVSGWAWDVESKLRLALKPQDDGMIAQAAGQSAASATFKSCFSCREEDDIEITYSTL